jgi:hypothetical protein
MRVAGPNRNSSVIAKFRARFSPPNISLRPHFQEKMFIERNG